MSSRRDEILRRLDLVAEFQKHGGRIPPGVRPNADGWLPVHAIDRKDKKPSAALNVGDDQKLRWKFYDHGTKQGFAFFDLLARMPRTPFITGRDAYRHCVGRQGCSPTKIPPPIKTPVPIKIMRRSWKLTIIGTLRATSFSKSAA